MKAIILSKENIFDYTTKQEGRGRQGLYLSLHNIDGMPDQEIYWGSVYPTPQEHWGLYTKDEVFSKQRAVSFDEDGNPTDFEDVAGEFVDANGEDCPADRIFSTIFDGIVAMVSGDEVVVDDEEEE